MYRTVSAFNEKFAHTEIIRRKHLFLVENLDAKYTNLLDVLYQTQVLTPAEKDSIGSQATTDAQNQALLALLKRKTKNNFDKFLDALERAGQRFIRDELQPHRDTIRYDTIRDAILTCARKPTWVSLIYRTQPTTKKCKNRKKTKVENRYAQK